MIHNHEVESSSLSLATGQGRYETAKTALSLSGCSSARLEYTSGGRVVAGSNPVIPTNLDTQASIYIDASFFYLYSISVFRIPSRRFGANFEC